MDVTPMICHSCGKSVGFAKLAHITHDNGMVEMVYRCMPCNHKYYSHENKISDVPDPDPIILAKLQRRDKALELIHNILFDGDGYRSADELLALCREITDITTAAQFDRPHAVLDAFCKGE